MTPTPPLVEAIARALAEVHTRNGAREPDPAFSRVLAQAALAAIEGQGMIVVPCSFNEAIAAHQAGED